MGCFLRKLQSATACTSHLFVEGIVSGGHKGGWRRFSYLYVQPPSYGAMYYSQTMHSNYNWRFSRHLSAPSMNHAVGVLVCLWGCWKEDEQPQLQYAWRTACKLWTGRITGGAWSQCVFSPTAIALGSSAIGKVSGQNCFCTLYGSLGGVLGPPKGSAEGSTKVLQVSCCRWFSGADPFWAAKRFRLKRFCGRFTKVLPRFHRGSTKVWPRLRKFVISLVIVG